MAKQVKQVRAKLDRAKDLHGRPFDILRIGKVTVGEIQNINHRLQARSNHGKVFHINSLSEGLKDLLSEYHLHAK